MIVQSKLLQNISNIEHGFTSNKISAADFAKIKLATYSAKQVHKNILAWQENAANAPGVEADAIATQTAEKQVGVYTADCTPILIAATHKNRAVGVLAIHAGWRGTALKIAQKTLSEFILEVRKNNSIDALTIAVGPTIRKEAFEVGEEVVAAFPEAEKLGLATFLRVENDQKKFLFNLPAENIRQLKEAAENAQLPYTIDDLKICTFTQSNNFPSFRKHREKAGRLLAFIRLTCY